MNKLKKYGATDRFFAEASIYPDLNLARIVSQYKKLYKIVTEYSEGFAEISGKLRFETTQLNEYPAVGDFVMVDRVDMHSGNAIIHKVLTRKSSFERIAVGLTNQTQVVAANIDIIFICMSLNNDYNLSRLERYLSVAWDSRAKPVIILTKSDLCDNLEDIMSEISSIAIGVEIISTSRFDKMSVEKVLSFIKKETTASFIGSSGVGKSTLINMIAGKELFNTSSIRDDDKGRHTTTSRELIILPQGGILIDTPGMRELGVDSVDLSKSFTEIDMLVKECRFNDCTHTSEPECAVLKAIESGRLDKRRLENYKKLQKEARYDGLSAKQIETEKLNSMFGSFNEMKRAKNFAKKKNNGR
ncbi:MAG: ribosome small subunit-dependent GTPase A [Armatimonadota bacterium]